MDGDAACCQITLRNVVLNVFGAMMHTADLWKHYRFPLVAAGGGVRTNGYHGQLRRCLARGQVIPIQTLLTVIYHSFCTETTTFTTVNKPRANDVKRYRIRPVLIDFLCVEHIVRECARCSE